MNIHIAKSVRCLALLVCWVIFGAAHAGSVETPTSAADDDASHGRTTTFPSADDDDKSDDDSTDWSGTESSGRHHHHHDHGNNDDVVSIGRNAELAEGQHAHEVVAVFGSATSAGDVDDAVVSVLGNTRVTGRVGDSAVAVMGNVFVNSEVNGDVVAVMGNVTLGPNARVRGDVVIIGGELTRDPNARVGGGVQHVFDVNWHSFDWVRPWIERCLLYGRPLAFGPGLGWVWGIALGLLALYLFIALLFRSAVERCVYVLETEPGHSILAALVTMLLTPVLFVLLFVTVLGIAAVPFLAIAILGAAVFGKIVLLASIGRRCTPMLAANPGLHTVVGVLVGGGIALLLYTIPIVGFIVYKLLGILGLGVVVYTLLIAVRAGRARQAAGGGGGTAPGVGPEPGGGIGPGTGPGAGMGRDEGGFVNADAAARSRTATPGAGVSLGESSPPSAGTPASMPRAGFGIRMGALLLDLILVSIVFHGLGGHSVDLIALAAYGAVMWKLKSATIGGIICGLQVVRLDGRPMDWPTAIVRALSCFLSLAVVGLGFLWIAIDSGSQAWHDKIAGTVVVRAPKGASLV